MNSIQTIQLDGKTVQAYLALPESGGGPGVIVIHAWWGLNEFFQKFCQRLAGEGFIALAPDLYHGRSASTIGEAKKLRSGLDRDRARKEIAAWIDYLRANPATGGTPLGVIGFSLGAFFALQMVEEKPADIIAVVTFYGTRSGKYNRTQAAFLGHFAEADVYVSQESTHKLEASLRSAGREVECYVYPGTQHWFFEDDRPESYQETAASLAWDRTVQFLRGKLAK